MGQDVLLNACICEQLTWPIGGHLFQACCEGAHECRKMQMLVKKAIVHVLDVIPFACTVHVLPKSNSSKLRANVMHNCNQPQMTCQHGMQQASQQARHNLVITQCILLQPVASSLAAACSKLSSAVTCHNPV